MKSKAAILLVVFALTAMLTWSLDPLAVADSPPLPGAHSERESNSLRVANPMVHEFQRITELDSIEERVRQMILLANSAPIEEIGEWHRFSLIGIDDLLLRQIFLDLTAERWLVSDPESLIIWKRHWEEHQIHLYLSRWAENDPEAAMAYINKQSGTRRSDMIFEVMDHLLEQGLDPGQEWATKFLSQELPGIPEGSRSHLPEELIEKLARLDLDLTINEINSWPIQKQYGSTTPIAREIFARDFREGVDFLSSKFKGRELINHVRWCLTDRPELSQELFRRAKDLPEGLLEGLVFESLDGLGPGGRLDWLTADLADYGLRESRTRHFKRAAAQSPSPPEFLPRRLAMINDSNFDRTLRKSLLQSQIKHWQHDDPGGLDDWLAGLKNREMIEIANSALAQRESNTQSTAVLSIPDQLQELIEGDDRNEILIDSTNVFEVRKLISTYQALEPEKKSHLIEKARDDFRIGNLPIEFRKIILQEAASSSNAEQMAALKPQLESAAHSLVNDDPQDAVTWINSLPDGPEKVSAAQTALKAWRGFDPEGASAWQETLPPEYELKE